MSTTVIRIATAALAGASLWASGCASPPQGSSGGRIDPYVTTPGEAGSRLPSTTELGEFSDQVTQQLVGDLAQVPEFNQYRGTIVFGDLQNKTGIVPTSDFEAMRTKIRTQLMSTSVAKDRFRFVENRQRYEDLRKRELGSSDVVNENRAPTPAGTRITNDEHTYMLNGDMYRVARGGETVNAYYMSFNLMRLSDGELVWESRQYTSKRAVR